MPLPMAIYQNKGLHRGWLDIDDVVVYLRVPKYWLPDPLLQGCCG